MLNNSSIEIPALDQLGYNKICMQYNIHNFIAAIIKFIIIVF